MKADQWGGSDGDTYFASPLEHDHDAFGPILLRRSPPPDDTSLSSFFYGWCTDRGVPPEVCLAELGDARDDALQRLDLTAGIVLDRVCYVMGTKRLATRPMSLHYDFGMSPPAVLLEPGGRGRIHANWTQFCPLCVTRRGPTFLNRYWRSALVFRCEVHNVMLIDRCPWCGSAVDLRDPTGKRPLWRCARCDGPLTTLELAPLPSGTLEIEKALHGCTRRSRTPDTDNPMTARIATQRLDPLFVATGGIRGASTSARLGGLLHLHRRGELRDVLSGELLPPPMPRAVLERLAAEVGPKAYRRGRRPKGRVRDPLKPVRAALTKMMEQRSADRGVTRSRYTQEPPNRPRRTPKFVRFGHYAVPWATVVELGRSGALVAAVDLIEERKRSRGDRVPRPGPHGADAEAKRRAFIILNDLYPNFFLESTK